MAKEILDVGAAAEYLHITRATLYKLAKEKKIPGLKIGGQWRFSKERLDELFAEGFEPGDSVEAKEAEAVHTLD
ncbi:MAG: helix-turn-helix domain-containing protein [Candidatus Eisenbacteria bacterium]|nr:helix-turn-helix domain-containing protein [Candidatus Eisenbacteria bacterium]